MVTLDTFRQLALSLPEAMEEAHFEKPSFRVRKKIFATYDAAAHRASLKLSAIDQDVFCSAPTGAMYPVPGGWGRQGWTLVELSRVPEAFFSDALRCAYCAVAPKKLADSIRPQES